MTNENNHSDPTPTGLPPYEPPQVTTYSEDQVLKELGDAKALTAFDPLSPNY